MLNGNKKSKNSAKQQNIGDNSKKQRKNSVLKTIAFIWILLLLLFLLYQNFDMKSVYSNSKENNDELSGVLDNNIKASETPDIFSKVVYNKIADVNLENNIPRLDKELSEDVFDDTGESYLEKYTDQKITEYRIYLLSVNQLINKFYHGEDFSIELEHIKTQNLPGEIKDILLILENYVTNITESQDYINVNFVDSDFISDLIQIKKKSNNFEKKKKLHDKINSFILTLNEYFFSKDFQDQFFN